jgi:large subunit ribosomal protein L23
MYKGNIIIKPLLTEKTMREVENGKYTFAVGNAANKKIIKKVVEDQFGVNVTGIVTVKVKGRTKRVGQKRLEVKLSPWKKAIVTVKKGQKIDIFSVGK